MQDSFDPMTFIHADYGCVSFKIDPNSDGFLMTSFQFRNESKKLIQHLGKAKLFAQIRDVILTGYVLV